MFIALRDLRFARGRFALMGAVVVLIAVLGVILSGLATGLADSGISSLRALPATSLAFQPSASGELFTRSTVTRATWQAWARQPGVQQAAPLGYALVHARASRGAHPRGQLDLAVFGVEPGSFIAPTLTAGVGLASGPGIVISQDIAKKGVRIGDVLTVDQVGTRLPVIGETGAASFGHVGVVYASLATWQRLHYGLPGQLPAGARAQATAVALRLASGTATAVIDHRLGTRTITRQAAYAASPGYSAESGTMGLIRGFLYVISGLVVGAFFTVWTIQRKAELALLRALGATTGYLLRDAFAQVVTILVAATGIGTGIGLALGSLLSGSAPFSLQAGPVATAAGLLVALGVAGALAAVRRITGIDPATALGDHR
ncbi:MAG: ABC transporter permease [Gemmatimonadota bacterium]